MSPAAIPTVPTKGSDLRPGDAILTWCGVHRIAAFEPYPWADAQLGVTGTRIASDGAGWRMTIFAADTCKRLV